MSDQLTHPIMLTLIPLDAVTEMLSFYPQKQHSVFTRACVMAGDEKGNDLYALHKESLTSMVPQLLAHIAHGAQNDAAALLDTHPLLALETADVTDYSGREFKNITAFQLAVWARDTHMLRMIISAIPHTAEGAIIVDNLLEQLDTVIKYGVTYTVTGQPPVTESYFSLKPLKDAYRAYLNAYDAVWAHRVMWDAVEAAWLEVGKCQRNLPAVVAQHYGDPDLTFEPYPDFKSAPLRQRSLEFYNYLTNSKETWFGGRLGSDFAILCGREARGATGWCVRTAHGWWIGGGNGGRAVADLAAIEALDLARTGDILDITEQLKQLRDSMPEHVAQRQRPAL